MAGPQAVDDPRAERLIARGAPTLLIEFGGDLCVATVLDQTIDLGDDFRLGLTHLASVERHGHDQNFRSPSLEAHLGGDRGPISVQGDILNDQAGHAFAITDAGGGIFPEPRKILRERQNLAFLFRGDDLLRVLVVLFTSLAGLLHLPEFFVPERLEGVGHQAVIGIPRI